MHQWEKGFTLYELVGVVAVVTIVAMIAYPSMQSFVGRNDDASAATRISRTINRARDQARRRNRAYVVDFALMVANRPGGRIDFYESKSASCRVSIDNVVANRRTQYTLSESLPVGGTEVDEYSGPNEELVGIRGWRVGTGAITSQRVRLCLAPDGSTSIAEGATPQPLPDGFQVLVQRYGAGHLGQPVGPMRRIQMTFAGPARLAVK